MHFNPHEKVTLKTESKIGQYVFYQYIQLRAYVGQFIQNYLHFIIHCAINAIILYTVF